MSTMIAENVATQVATYCDPLMRRDRAWITVENAANEYARYGARSSSTRLSTGRLVAEIEGRTTTGLCRSGRDLLLAVRMWRHALTFCADPVITQDEIALYN